MDNQGEHSCLLHTNQVAKKLGTVIVTGNIGVSKHCIVVIHESCVTWINFSEVFVVRTLYLHNSVC